jgi:hypothetical protein
MSEPTQQAAQPWWKYGHVWLIISGPAAVVIAGFFTLYLAVSGVDPVIDPHYYRNGIEINQRLSAPTGNLAPAQQARNHAATGVSAPKE